MTMTEEREKQIKLNIQKALEELTEATTHYGPDSPQVAAAKEKRALAEKELVDSRS